MLVPKRESIELPWIIVLTLVLLLCLNVLYFIATSASPHVRSDAWYFLDELGIKWHTSGFGLSDIFVKRGLTDHAQPLNKLVLFLNYRFFGLDFKVEALFGYFGLLSIIFTLLVLSSKSIHHRDIRSIFALLGAIAILSSLNTTEIYTWPLVAFGFLTLFLSIVIALLTWSAVSRTWSAWAIVVSSLFALLIGDTASIILWLSLVTTFGFVILSIGPKKSQGILQWFVASFFFIVLYFYFLNVNFLFGDSGRHLTDSRSDIAWQNIEAFMEGMRLIFSSSIVHREHLARFGKYEFAASWVIASLVLYFYVRHFVLLYKSKLSMSKEKFLTTFILIYSTISIIAIVYGRVPVFGVDYLAQPRYVFVYQLIPFALLLDHALSGGRDQSNSQRTMPYLFAPFIFILVSLQFMYALNAHGVTPYINMYIDRQVKEVGRYLLDRDLPSGDCPEYSSGICRMSVDRRNAVLDMLELRNLNYLNPVFQWRYGLFPFDVHMNAESKGIKVLGWGPQSIERSSGDIGVWVKLERGLIDARRQITARIEEHSVSVIANGNVLTFSLPRSVSANAGVYSMRLVDNGSDAEVKVGELEVKINASMYEGSSESLSFPVSPNEE